MPKFAVNLSMLFTEAPFLERFALARAAGFDAVEVQFPYDYDVNDIKRSLDEEDLHLVLFNLPAGDFAGGERGLAALWDRRDEFRQGVDTAIEYARVLRPDYINCLAGIAEETPENDLALLQNVRIAAEALAGEDLKMTLEPINAKDSPGFALPTQRSALDLIQELDQPNLGLQLDVYHAGKTDEDPLVILRDHADLVSHIQIADLPDRHQPGTGTVDWSQLFTAIDGSGYAGYVSLEYIPEGPTVDSFTYLRRAGFLP